MPDRDFKSQARCRLITVQINQGELPGLIHLTSWLKAKGITQKRLAEMVGTTKDSVSNWAQGRWGPSSVWLPLIADALG